MRIAIVTAVFGRHDLTKIVLDYYRKLKLRSAHDIVLIAVGSEGAASRNLCESSGWEYCEFPNAPLSQKFNHLFQYAHRFEPDLVVLSGSDDLISQQVINYYALHVSPIEPDLVGLKDLYLHNIPTRETRYFPGYPPATPKSAKTIGAGRCFSRRILDQMNWTPWEYERINRGLDSTCSRRLRYRGVGERCVTMEQTGGIAVDIKHPHTGLTPWRQFSKHSTESGFNLAEHFPEEFSKLEPLYYITTFEDNELYEVPFGEGKRQFSGLTIKRLISEGKLKV